MINFYSNKPFFGKIKIKSYLLVETGLHIGGADANLNIGGIDHSVIRDLLTQNPYLPGSSIKGKLRSILERFLNKPLNRQGSRDTYRYESDDLLNGFSKIKDQFIPFEGSQTCELSRLFGSTGKSCWVEEELAASNNLLDSEPEAIPYDNQNISCVKIKGRNAPARLIVRDSHLTDDSVQALEKANTDLYMTEWKFENGLDRITSSANPRQIERIPKGAKFELEIVYTVEQIEHIIQDIKNLGIALAILEDDALGGHGSRGYGKVKLQDIKIFCYPKDYYIQGNLKDIQPIVFKDISDFLSRFGTLQEACQTFLPSPRGENNG